MKVDSSTSNSSLSSKGGVQGTRQGSSAGAASAGASASTAASAGASAGAGGDANVNLSALSSQLRSLAASGEADIDTAHVESIKQAIKDGTLSIDTGKIADGILETARTLLQTQTPTGG